MSDMNIDLTVLGAVVSTSEDRRAAALTLAEQFSDKRQLAFYLVELGLADHHGDGTFTPVPGTDEQSWFRPKSVTREVFCLTPEQLYF